MDLIARWLCGLLIYLLIAPTSTQERERVWHTTTPASPTTGPSTSSTQEPVSTVPPTAAPPVVAEPPKDSRPAVLEENVAATESPPEPTEHVHSEVELPREDVLNQNITTAAPAEEPVQEKANPAVEDKKEKKERKWMSAIKEEKVSSEEENVPSKESEPVSKKEEEIPPTKATVKEEKEESEKSSDTTDSTESVESSVEEGSKNISKKKKKPRKWISVPGEVELDSEPIAEEKVDNEVETPTMSASDDQVNEEVQSSEASAESSPEKEVVDEYSINATDLGLPKNISELLLAAEEGIPIVQETIISKKTTVYVTISESLDAEPLYVNLTGIRYFTGQERRLVAGCLDLSDLMITGEEAKEVIQRMAKHRFHRLDLSNNNITEFPPNSFSPVAFTVRELRLDGNPLASNDQGEASVLHRGGLFHLTELRELNLSSCGLEDMDYFTPWNSNHLEVVDLSNNRLLTVPSNLQFFHKLKKLYVDGNPIKRVTELPFALLWNLQVLSLADCQISSIVSDPFRNMEKLKEISIEGNNLTRISEIRLPHTNSGVKMFLSGNPWHCSCDILNFIEHYHYAIRDLEYIRCASPRWLEGLRTAYLTKEILSLDSIDGDCVSASPHVSIPTSHQYVPPVRADRLEILALAVFILAAIFMLCHVLWARKKDKFKFEDDRDDIHYIRIEKKPNFR